MTPRLRLKFSISGRRLACAGAVLVASLGQASAGDSLPKNTVFKSDAGEVWTVSIKPAGRPVADSSRSVPVPEPLEVAPVLAQVVEAAPESDPAPPPLPEAPVSEESPGSPRTAHGVTIVPDVRTSVELLGRRYSEAYRSIPFNRAEYDANPSYRHEAAMELVFGQMRPTTIIRHQTPRPVEEPVFSPYQPYLPAHGDLWRAGAFQLRNPVYDPPILPQGCYWPAY